MSDPASEPRRRPPACQRGRSASHVGVAVGEGADRAMPGRAATSVREMGRLFPAARLELRREMDTLLPEKRLQFSSLFGVSSVTVRIGAGRPCFFHSSCALACRRRALSSPRMITGADRQRLHSGYSVKYGATSQLASNAS